MSLRVLADRFGPSTAVTDQYGTQLSYLELHDKAHALAAHLIERGVATGTPVAVLLPNCADAVWVTYGIRLAGAAETPLSWGYTAAELGWCATLAKFRLVVTSADRVAQMHALGLDTLLPGSIAAWTSGDRHPFPPVSANTTGRVLFTSGTTGRHKGVHYSHEKRWIGEQLLKATLPFTPAPGSKILLATPFSHGASLLTFAWCDYGGEVILLNDVAPPHIGGLLRGGDIDALFAPPTVIAKLAGAFGNERFHGLRCVFTGTQPLGAALYAKAQAMFGPVVRITYGKTECINPITVLGPADTDAYLGQTNVPAGACVGWPAPGVEIEIRSEEVWLRARHMSDGLIGSDGFIDHDPQGWHATGDLGLLDENGRLVLVGRVADVIKTGGYRVNPDEIEDCLAGMPACGPVIVAGLPSEYWGEIIVAVAEQARDGWQAEAASRLASLSRYKWPRLHVAVRALPRNAQGKVSRKQVVKMLQDTCEFTDGPYPQLISKES